MEKKFSISIENSVMLEEKQKNIDREPFKHLKINDVNSLNSIEGRKECNLCCKSRKFFCYTCCIPVIDVTFFPRIKLPIKVDIIKHPKEIDGKSTAVHATIIAPEDVKIYTYPDFPDWSKSEKVVLIFPSKTAITIEDLFWQENLVNGTVIQERIQNNLPVTRAVFIDCTWHQTKSIYKDQRLRDLPCVVLRNRISQFWRHQKKSPRWHLATIEALHQFLTELHTCAYGAIEDYSKHTDSNVQYSFTQPHCNYLTQPYQGQYDNLLYFFKYMYDKIHWLYDHNKLYAYKRPLI